MSSWNWRSSSDAAYRPGVNSWPTRGSPSSEGESPQRATTQHRLEGGNLAISGTLTDAAVPTLSALTTSHRHTHGSPVGLMSMTSEASARAAHLAARIWTLEPKLRPETVRGLIVHSASWSKAMLEDLAAGVSAFFGQLARATSAETRVQLPASRFSGGAPP